ncbi:hypothetical protein NW754_001458 [Fusarium falciforme]|nr:hypothetical protein NW754_001458 [Fusarium falciforme]
MPSPSPPIPLPATPPFIFLHTIGPVLNNTQLAALQSYIRAGGGFVGIHGAAAGNLDSEWWYLVGAHFAFHPAPEEGTLVVEGAGHEIMSGSGVVERRWMDECWYNFKSHPRENANLRVYWYAAIYRFVPGRQDGRRSPARLQEKNF